MATSNAPNSTSHVEHQSEVFFRGRPSCCGGCSYWWRNYHWVITKDYVEYSKGWCCTSVDTLQNLRIKDIRYESGKCCCQACATIVLDSFDETDPTLRIQGIPNAEFVYEKLRDVVTSNATKTRLAIQEGSTH